MSIEAGATSATEPNTAPWEDRPPFALQALTVLWALVAGAMSARVYPGLLLFCAVALGGLLLGTAWLYLLVRRGRRRRNAAHQPLDWRGRLAWAFCPLAGALMTVLYLAGIPLIVRVMASENALISMADSVRPDGSAEGGRAGLMFVRSVSAEDGFVYYETNYGFIFQMYGLLFSPDGAAPIQMKFQGYPTSHHHLFGRWWTFHARD